MAFTLMTWSSRTAYCSREKPSFFHGNMSLSPLFPFFHRAISFWGSRHRRLNALYRLSKYERGFRMWNRYIDNMPMRRYHCFDNASSQLLSFFKNVIYPGDYAKQNIVLIITDTGATQFHSSYKAILLRMINTTSPFNIQPRRSAF